MPRRAVLVFADEAHRDLARRAFPNAARPLLNLPGFSGLSPETDIHLFTSASRVAPFARGIHRQSGHDFAARFENAIERIAQLGYDEVVAVGRDCPGLRALDIQRAFAELASKKLVLGPDHRGGCYLIALRTTDRELLRGVRWRRNTDCAQLLQRGGAGHVFLLPAKHDLDSWNDLRMFARTDDPLAHLAKFLLRVICAVRDGVVHFVSLAARQMRIRQQIPPPAFAA